MGGAFSFLLPSNIPVKKACWAIVPHVLSTTARYKHVHYHMIARGGRESMNVVIENPRKRLGKRVANQRSSRTNKR